MIRASRPQSGEDRLLVGGETAARRRCATHTEAASGRGAVSALMSSHALPTGFAGGRYRVKALLGEGGSKRVYLAHDTRLERRVAVAGLRTEGVDEAGLARVRAGAPDVADPGGPATR